jgi:predicted RNase H-like nuclease
MHAQAISTLYSERFDELRSFFQGIQPPYTLQHIREFNAIYRRIYPMLSREEKRRAEDYVDSLIEGLERKEWAPRIFGVV